LEKNGLTKNIFQMVVNDGDEAYGTIRLKETPTKKRSKKIDEIFPCIEPG